MLRLTCLLALFSATASALEKPAEALRPWPDYRVIMWVGESAHKKPGQFPLFTQRLREMNVDAAMVHGEADNQLLLENKLPYYVENMVNRGLCLKWNSKVQDWDKFVTDWAKTGRSDQAFVREYTFEDPQWQEASRAQMRKLAERHKPFAPLLYDIRDELSVTLSANPFDYNFHPLAIAAFQKYLEKKYGKLDALNQEWQTTFATWEEVKPFSTDQIKNRMASGDALPRGNPDWQAVQALKFEAQAKLDAKQLTAWNLAPWCDFRSYLDTSLAQTLDDLRQAARGIDPATPVGIEGTQMPAAFGGYDLWKLSQVLDWVEPYDIANAREIFGSFMPGKTFLTTVGEPDADSVRRRLWHLLLLGDKGCIIWWSEDCLDWKDDSIPLTARAQALAPVFAELKSPLARLFLRATRVTDPVYIHYSQPSIQVAWLIESTVDGSTWPRRFSSYEATHNQHAKVRDQWLNRLTAHGLSPVFVSSAQIEQGLLKDKTGTTLVLPDSHALSNAEWTELKAYTTAEGPPNQVLFSGAPGIFNENGRRLTPLEQEKRGPFPMMDGTRKPNEAIAAILADHPREVTWPLAADLRVHRYQLGAARLLAFERNTQVQMGEDLKPINPAETAEKPEPVTAKLAKPAFVYDLRARKFLGQTDEITFTLNPSQPSLFALLEEKVEEATIIDWLGK